MGDGPATGVRVLIIGAAGMLGRKLAASLVLRRRIGSTPISHLTLVDRVAPPSPVGSPPGEVDAFEVDAFEVDIVDPGTPGRLIRPRPDVVFHLAAIVSGEAEQDRALGYAVNLDATRAILEAIRDEGAHRVYRPRLVYASTAAVFGAPLPDRIGDDFLTAPATSYGTQKAIGELLINDDSRRGSLDGISLRLPTICVRPGTPNRAASGFFSNIIREPLVGRSAVLPVDDALRHWFASPRSAVGFLEHAAALDTERLGTRRAVNMPGVSATVADQLEALRRIAGEAAVDLIRREPDPEIAGMVSTWPQDFDPQRALDLGFVAEDSFDDIVRVHIEDELGGQLHLHAGRDG